MPRTLFVLFFLLTLFGCKREFQSYERPIFCTDDFSQIVATIRVAGDDKRMPVLISEWGQLQMRDLESERYRLDVRRLSNEVVYPIAQFQTDFRDSPSFSDAPMPGPGFVQLNGLVDSSGSRFLEVGALRETCFEVDSFRVYLASERIVELGPQNIRWAGSAQQEVAHVPMEEDDAWVVVERVRNWTSWASDGEAFVTRTVARSLPQAFDADGLMLLSDTNLHKPGEKETYTTIFNAAFSIDLQVKEGFAYELEIFDNHNDPTLTARDIVASVPKMFEEARTAGARAYPRHFVADKSGRLELNVQVAAEGTHGTFAIRLTEVDPSTFGACGNSISFEENGETKYCILALDAGEYDFSWSQGGGDGEMRIYTSFFDRADNYILDGGPGMYSYFRFVGPWDQNGPFTGFSSFTLDEPKEVLVISTSTLDGGPNTWEMEFD